MTVLNTGSAPVFPCNSSGLPVLVILIFSCLFSSQFLSFVFHYLVTISRTLFCLTSNSFDYIELMTFSLSTIHFIFISEITLSFSSNYFLSFVDLISLLNSEILDLLFWSVFILICIQFRLG